MDPISPILAAIAAAVASQRSEEITTESLRRLALGEAWRAYQDSLGLVSAADLVRFDRELEEGNLPPLWEWDTEFSVELDQDVPVGRPPFEDLYAVSAGDGWYVIAVYETSQEAFSHARHIERDRLAQEAAVYVLSDVPYHDGKRLLDASDPYSTTFYDGYEVGSFAGQYVVEDEPIWDYNMREHDAFEDWDEDSQQERRERVLDALPRRQVGAGKTLYSSDDDAGTWVDTDELEWVPVTDSSSSATDRLLEWGWRKQPRLIQLQTTQDIPDILFVGSSSELEDVEEVLGAELEDYEAMSMALDEHLPEVNGIAFAHGLGPNRMLALISGDDAVESLEVVRIDPLDGEYVRGVRRT